MDFELEYGDDFTNTNSPPPLALYEEKPDISSDILPFNQPLAVPVVSETKENSRPDAKSITETRLSRLRQLSSKPEEFLTEDQVNEKKRIIRLEKNRRAAAMSRRKKKVYIKNLEERAASMAKHMAILEMNNATLRGMIQQLSTELYERAGITVPPLHNPVLPPFSLPLKECDSDDDEPPRKRRRLDSPDLDSDLTAVDFSCSMIKSEPPPLVPLDSSTPTSAEQSQPPELVSVSEGLHHMGMTDSGYVLPAFSNPFDDPKIHFPILSPDGANLQLLQPMPEDVFLQLPMHNLSPEDQMNLNLNPAPEMESFYPHMDAVERTQ